MNTDDAVTAFVVAGGRSSRMGSLGDKALLQFTGNGPTLIEHAAGRLLTVTSDVRLLTGARPRYHHLGLPIVCDEVCGAGPLGGLHAALWATTAPRVLWLAVDLPHVSVETLRSLVIALETNDVVMCRSPRGDEPLAAAFRVAPIRPLVERALLSNRLKITDAVGPVTWLDVRSEGFANANTPEEAHALGLQARPPLQFERQKTQ